MEARREDEAPVAHQAQGWIAHGLRRAVGNLEVVESCTILTTASNRLVLPLHDRMPVILSPDEYRTWLERTTTDPTGLKKMFQPFPADLMEMYPVSPMVNSVKNDGPELVVPVNGDPLLELPLSSQPDHKGECVGG
jgi:putative SOS response-associated peptidase YedK